MRIEYIAHATFVIVLNDGRRLIIDPYQGNTFGGRFDYPPFVTRADFALITHEHIDHNYTADLQGHPVIVRNAWQDERLHISSVFAWHDKFGGTKFGGGVQMKIIEADGIRLGHLGDCGEILGEEQIAALGKIDVLLLPVGGFYTMDGDEAADLARRIGARTTIPCHYRSPLCSLPIEGPDRFLAHFPGACRWPEYCAEVRELPEGVVVMPMKMVK